MIADGETETTTGAGGARLIVTTADFVASATLVALTEIACEAQIIAGAVYAPVDEMDPTAELIDQTTAVLEALLTDAVNCAVPPCI